MKKNLILSALIIVIGSIVCVTYNQLRKSRNGAKKQKLMAETEVSKAYMINTFEPIEDFEMIYFDDQRGLVQIKNKAK
jgi:hypothetical protein